MGDQKNKKCTKCGENKSVTEFDSDKQKKDGLCCRCKVCRAEQFQKFKIEHPNKYRQKNIDSNVNQRNRRLMLYQERKDEICKERREYRKNFKERVRITNQKSSQKKRSNPKYRLNDSFSSLMRAALKGGKNGYKWESLVGYTLDDLVGHMEKQFQDGMSWDNYGKKGWHIDHIIPRYFFSFESFNDVEFKKCWALSNLQPLWEYENCSKQNRHPFEKTK